MSQNFAKALGVSMEELLGIGDGAQRVAELERVVREREHDRQLLRLRQRGRAAERVGARTSPGSVFDLDGVNAVR